MKHVKSWRGEDPVLAFAILHNLLLMCPQMTHTCTALAFYTRIFKLALDESVGVCGWNAPLNEIWEEEKRMTRTHIQHTSQHLCTFLLIHMSVDSRNTFTSTSRYHTHSLSFSRCVTSSIHFLFNLSTVCVLLFLPLPFLVFSPLCSLSPSSSLPLSSRCPKLRKANYICRITWLIDHLAVTRCFWCLGNRLFVQGKVADQLSADMARKREGNKRLVCIDSVFTHPLLVKLMKNLTTPDSWNK